MRHRSVVAVLASSLFIFFALAGLSEAAKIVAASGDVLVKPGAAASWQAASVGQELQPEALVQTQANGACTIAFDDAQKRLATVKEDSYVKVESLGPDQLLLTGGRVFSLIKSGEGASDFRVKTPTAISGARGTAWTTEFVDGKTSVACFEAVIFVAGLNAQGETTQEIDVRSGFGVSVDDTGVLGAVAELSPEKLAEGQQNKESVESVVKALPVQGGAEAPASSAGTSTASGFQPKDAATVNPLQPSATVASTTGEPGYPKPPDTMSVPDPSSGMNAPDTAVPGGPDTTAMNEPFPTDTTAMNEPLSPDATSGFSSDPMAGGGPMDSGAPMGDAFGGDPLGSPLDMTQPGGALQDPSNLQDLTQQVQQQTHEQQVFEQQSSVHPPGDGSTVITNGT